MWRLNLQGLSAQGEKAAREMTITRFPCTLGRHSDCDFRMHSPFISRRQCCFFLKDDQVWVKDLESRNGTMLNSKPLKDCRPLRQGDVLDLAGFLFQVHLTPQEPGDGG